MRKANKEWLIKSEDTGFLTEDERLLRAKGQPLYDFFRSGKLPIKDIINAADIASLGKVENKDRLLQYLKSDDPAIRYWGATGLLILGGNAKSEMNVLKSAVNDESVSVAVVASEALYRLGEKEIAYKGFKRALATDREFAQTFAMNSIYLIDDSSEELKNAVVAALNRMEVKNRSKYNYRAAMNLVNKWELDVDL